ncbi:Heat shock protein DnaJ N-terminal [Penicillium robsamsonii]|uniref:Heat shock protein DnaJ N-terminal n=1 Tax=Penicillium robsamsonii TaxID=1792511 RepID=UPI00254673F8|nr:Heat shock protein DnaJ N-terminal [Penicillium robsamsonii]KAJ5824618.1 Heat shock protein DnaJ N-terminal [Penicillium robsamsonii]
MSTIGVTIDAYAILGVERNARIQDINLAYKRLALKLHPDKAGNTVATVERFRKIQDAVELLRDKDRRYLLDEALKSKTKRHLDPEDDIPPWSYRGNHYRSSKRERHGYDFDYWPGQFTESPYEYKSMNQRQYSPSYYYSYGTSVHMDPNSAESKAKLAQFQEENTKWENEWAGIDPEVQKARAERRKANMQARMKRDPGDIVVEQDHNVEGVLDDLDFGHQFNHFADVLPEEDIKTCNPADTFDAFAYEYAKASGSSPNYSDSPTSYGSTSSPKSAASNDSSVDFSTSCYSTNHTHSPDGHWNCRSTADDSNVNFPTYTHSADEHSSINATADDSESTTNSSTSDADKLINSYLVGHDSLRPLVSFLKQKLADPHGRYTIDDLGGELNGLMLETYCGWLENVRLSVPTASPMKVRNDPKVCSHLGYWYKEFCRPVCKVCNMWLPTYILTCPGCGMMACVRCKFSGHVPHLGSGLQEQ